MSGNFKSGLMDFIERQKSNNWNDNYDFRRFGPEQDQPFGVRVKAVVKRGLEALSLRSNRPFASLIAHESKLEWIYSQLQDEESRQVLIQVMAYRVLGHRKVKLPLNTPGYWQKLDALESEADKSDPIDLGFLGWKLDRHDLEEEGYPIQVYARAPSVFAQLLLEQYRCIMENYVIEVSAGDTVIDAGGCYGDTALYFAHKAGQSGRVFSFEFMPDNIKVFNRNLALNPALAGNIKIVPNPLWSISGQKMFVEGFGPAAHVTPVWSDSEVIEVETLTIDKLIEREHVTSVGFIKMDIEGAELEALKGAEETIRQYRPKLAISVYHNLEDFWVIPGWIDALGLNYRFYLRHFTVHAEETVLFAEVVR